MTDQHPNSGVPRHWVQIPFDLLFKNVTSSSLKLPTGKYLPSGKHPVIDQGEQFVGGFTDDDALVHPGPLPAVVFGDHTRCVKFAVIPFVQGADGVKVLAPSASVHPRFAYWVLKQAEIPSKGYARHFAVIRKLDLPLPPGTEQHRIVAAIESYCTRLDDAVATLERVQRNLKRYRASVLKAAVEGWLVPTEAELARAEGRTFEPASVLLERILAERRRRWEEVELAKLQAKGKLPKDDAWKAKYVEPVAPATSDFPALPEGWCWAGPEQIAAHEDYAIGIGPFGSNLKVSDYRDEGVPLVFVRNIRAESFGGDGTHYVASYKALELKPHIVVAGDLLITKMGEPPGDAAIYPVGSPDAVVTADCIRLRNHPTLSNTRYLLFAIRSPSCRGQIIRVTKGVAQKKVSLARFKGIAFPFPPLIEQARVAAEVDRLFSVTDATVHAVERELHRLSRLRQSILKWAFEGRLVDQDPSDEPASALLERIKAERLSARGAQDAAAAENKQSKHPGRRKARTPTA